MQNGKTKHCINYTTVCVREQDDKEANSIAKRPRKLNSTDRLTTKNDEECGEVYMAESTS
jgi:hypothetical protein